MQTLINLEVNTISYYNIKEIYKETWGKKNMQSPIIAKPLRLVQYL